MIKKYIFIFTVFVILLSSCSQSKDGLEFCNSKENSNNKVISKELSTYVDKRFDFSVDYPSNWDVEVDQITEPTETSEGDPMSGINIYIDKNHENKIYVYGQVSHIEVTTNPIHYNIESFKTKSGLNGTLYIREFNNKKEIIYSLDDEFIGLISYIPLDCYEENKEKIYDILRSIKLINKE